MEMNNVCVGNSNGRCVANGHGNGKYPINAKTGLCKVGKRILRLARTCPLCNDVFAGEGFVLNPVADPNLKMQFSITNALTQMGAEGVPACEKCAGQYNEGVEGIFIQESVARKRAVDFILMISSGGRVIHERERVDGQWVNFCDVVGCGRSGTAQEMMGVHNGAKVAVAVCPSCWNLAGANSRVKALEEMSFHEALGLCMGHVPRPKSEAKKPKMEPRKNEFQDLADLVRFIRADRGSVRCSHRVKGADSTNCTGALNGLQCGGGGSDHWEEMPVIEARRGRLFAFCRSCAAELQGRGVVFDHGSLKAVIISKSGREQVVPAVVYEFPTGEQRRRSKPKRGPTARDLLQAEARAIKALAMKPAQKQVEHLERELEALKGRRDNALREAEEDQEILELATEEIKELDSKISIAEEVLKAARQALAELEERPVKTFRPPAKSQNRGREPKKGKKGKKTG